MEINKNTHVYFIYDIRGRLCYIGQTSWLKCRMMAHFKSKLISKVTYLTYASKEVAELVEAYYIDKYKPFLNVMQYPSKVEDGRKLKDTFVIGGSVVDYFETDVTWGYGKMALDYPEFPVNQVRLPRGNFYMNTLRVYKVAAESNPKVVMMFYEYKNLVKVVVGKKGSKDFVPFTDIEKVYKTLPEKVNTINTYVDGLCSQLPKKIIDSLEEKDLIRFMTCTDTSVSLK